MEGERTRDVATAVWREIGHMDFYVRGLGAVIEDRDLQSIRELCYIHEVLGEALETLAEALKELPM